MLTDTDSLTHEIKTEDVNEDFSEDEKIINLTKYSAKSKYYDDSNKLRVGKMYDEIGGVAIKEFVGLKVKMNSFSVDNNSEHKKGKGVNKNNVTTINHGEYNDVLLNKKCWRQSIYSIQSKDHRVRSYEINIKISLYCFDEKIFILNNEYDELALGYQSYLQKKNSYLNNYSKLNLLIYLIYFCQAIKILF